MCLFVCSLKRLVSHCVNPGLWNIFRSTFPSDASGVNLSVLAVSLQTNFFRDFCTHPHVSDCFHCLSSSGCSCTFVDCMEFGPCNLRIVVCTCGRLCTKPDTQWVGLFCYDPSPCVQIFSCSIFTTVVSNTLQQAVPSLLENQCRSVPNERCQTSLSLGSSRLRIIWLMLVPRARMIHVAWIPSAIWNRISYTGRANDTGFSKWPILGIRVVVFVFLKTATNTKVNLSEFGRYTANLVPFLAVVVRRSSGAAALSERRHAAVLGADAGAAAHVDGADAGAPPRLPVAAGRRRARVPRALQSVQLSATRLTGVGAVRSSGLRV